jgi:hypothetical protein
MKPIPSESLPDTDSGSPHGRRVAAGRGLPERRRVLTPVARRAFRCRCGRPVFFPDLKCLGCGAPLGYDPERARLLPLRADEAPGFWRLAAGRSGGAGPHWPRYRRCGNAASAAQCNWLIDDTDDAAGGVPAAQALCRCCRLNRMIPDLGQPPNPLWWARIEAAKRRLVSLLIVLGLPLRSRLGEDPQGGLAFDLLRSQAGMAPVVTGHAGGIITVNVEEADDAHREALRASLGERYRTLLGHLRHESGHYYWQRLVAGTPWQAPFRAVFGDERAGYAQALQRHYQAGPAGSGVPGWAARHVSAYAAAHPWEDWAETWAHYLHMLDTLDTAWSFGLDARHLRLGGKPYGAELLYRRGAPGAAAFLNTVNTWIELAGVLNEMSRSMGLADFYPFVLPAPAVAKLHFVHLVVQGARTGARQEHGLPDPGMPHCTGESA